MDYRISVDYDDYFSNSKIIKAKNIEVIGEAVMFKTDKETLKLLEGLNISYMLHDSKIKRIKDTFKYKSGIYVGLLWVLFFIIMNNFRVSEIKFNGEYAINDEIEAYIKSQNQELLFFSFHKNNYQDLSQNLRSTYFEYEWIEVSKKGSKLLVTINTPNEDKIEANDIKLGNIVAKKSGMVNSFRVFSGTSFIEEKKYVNKGEVLIEGSTTGAKGYILATTYDEVKVKVMKENVIEELTGSKMQYTSIKLFKKSFNINKKQNYSKSDKISKTIFKIPYLLSINKIEESEKNDIIYLYDSDKATEMAKNIIIDSFTNNKVLNEEKIIRIEKLSLKENEDSFEILFLVKKLESIGEFIKRV